MGVLGRRGVSEEEPLADNDTSFEDCCTDEDSCADRDGDVDGAVSGDWGALCGPEWEYEGGDPFASEELEDVCSELDCCC